MKKDKFKRKQLVKLVNPITPFGLNAEIGALAVVIGKDKNWLNIKWLIGDKGVKGQQDGNYSRENFEILGELPQF